jgi:hypothetical protein
MPPSDAPSTRGLRDRPIGRLALLAVVLVLAALAARSCGSDGTVSNERAAEVARSVQQFEPDEVQVRLFRRGVDADPLWAVSLYKGTARAPTRVQLVIVDARTGEIVEDGR